MSQLHLKLSDLRKFCELDGFKKVINRIHQIRFLPDPKINLFKLESNQTQT